MRPAGWSVGTLPCRALVASGPGPGGGDVLVGGYVAEAPSRAPALARVRRGSLARSGEQVSVDAHHPVRKVADLTSLTADGDRIVALGAAHGGAHANVRWTIWTGTPAG